MGKVKGKITRGGKTKMDCWMDGWQMEGEEEEEWRRYGLLDVLPTCPTMSGGSDGVAGSAMKPGGGESPRCSGAMPGKVLNQSGLSMKPSLTALS